MLNNLEFLNKFKSNNKYDIISFWKSKFEDDVWSFEFSKTRKERKTIDFNFLLRDNSRLTDKKNRTTLYTFKTLILEFLIKDNMYLNAEETIIYGLNSVQQFFNVINHYDKNYSFAKYGFPAIDKDYLMMICNKRIENNNLFDVYEGKEALKELFIRIDFKEKETYTKDDINLLNDLLSGYNLGQELFPYLILPIQFSLEKILLNKNKNEKYIKEYDGYFREDDIDKSTTKKTLSGYLRVVDILIKMDGLKDESLSLPFKNDLELIYNYNFHSKKNKKFETFPIETIFYSLNKSIEFHFKYGDEIVESFVNFVENIKEYDLERINLNNHLNKKTDELLNNIVLESITPKLLELGVDRYQILNKSEYFSLLRENKSLLSLLKVYYGCAQFIVGSLMARRQSEIESMEIDCFDEHNLQLMFRKSKSYQHNFGIRDYISLPTPEIVIQILKNLKKIADVINQQETNGRIFAIPQNQRPCFASNDSVKSYENLDTLFDYLNIETIDGKRPYVRQHQLRRFFAMAFFWSSGFKSIDTLRWFLGHTNAQHVYHYIQENNSGEILNSVKAQYIGENVKKYENLSEIFENKFNTKNYNLISQEDLMEYIKDLLDDGSISVEPEFFEDSNGNKFEIILKVKNND